jgi:hypothetical protein
MSVGDTRTRRYLLNPRAEIVTVKAGATIATLEPIDLPTTTVASVRSEKDEMLWQLVEGSGEELTVEKEQLFMLLQQNAGVFATSKSDLGRTGKLYYGIDTGQAHQ